LEKIAMADIDNRLQQLVALLELTSDQKEAIDDLLTVAKQIDQLEATIGALPELQRNALMRYWAEPILQYGTNVRSYRRTFFGLAEMIKSSLGRD
jgi:hypothetical protein